MSTTSVAIGDQDRPFEVGTNQAEIFCTLPHRRDEQGRPLTLQAYYGLFETTERLLGGPLRDFLFSALRAGAERDGLRVDFTAADVGRWMDAPETEADEIAKPLNAMLAQLQAKANAEQERAKNGRAPLPEVGTAGLSTVEG